MDMDTPKAAAAAVEAAAVPAVAVEAAAVPAVAVEAAAAGLVGQRCDQALAALLPHLGLRGRRRCLERGGALCNGCPVSAAHRLVSGDVLTLVSPVAALSAAQALAAAGARLLSRQGDYAFFFKPAGLHTAALAGDAGPSLEGLLPALTAELPAPEVGAARPDPSAVSPFCRLLQRLDRETSGLVCAALRPEAVQAFRRAEALRPVRQKVCGPASGPPRRINNGPRGAGHSRPSPQPGIARQRGTWSTLPNSFLCASGRRTGFLP